MTWWHVGAAVALAVALLALVRRLPEPNDDLDGWVKPRYDALLTPRFLIATLLTAAAAAGLAEWRASAGTLPLWLVLAGAVVVPVAVDARTTFLPARLTRLCWVAMLMAAAIVLLRSSDRWHALGRMALCAGLASALMWLMWRLGGMGFADIGLVALVSLPTAAESMTLWFTGLLFGSFVGALAGAAVGLWRRGHRSALGTAFAYGPSLWLGPWLALLIGPL